MCDMGAFSRCIFMRYVHFPRTQNFPSNKTRANNTSFHFVIKQKIRFPLKIIYGIYASIHYLKKEKGKRKSIGRSLDRHIFNAKLHLEKYLPIL